MVELSNSSSLGVHMYKIESIVSAGLAFFISFSAQAGIVSYFDASWTDITTTPASGPIGVNSGDDLESFSNSGYVYPGWGGQSFDAEYIFYKITGSTLSIGLQTGYDIKNGVQNGYYGGDLALSFNGAALGDASTYEFAIDFGNETRDYNGKDAVDSDNNGDGIDLAGLYAVTAWNNDIYFDGPGGNSTGNNKNSSSPFAMDEGNQLLALGSGLAQLANGSATTNGSQMSYYRAYEFDLAALGLSDISTLDAHWTMSCGNDAVDGQVSLVPEPSVLVLLSTGLIGLFGTVVAKKNRNL